MKVLWSNLWIKYYQSNFLIKDEDIEEIIEISNYGDEKEQVMELAEVFLDFKLHKSYEILKKNMLRKLRINQKNIWILTRLQKKAALS